MKSIAIPVRIPENEVELVDQIVQREKLFVSRSDFTRFAIERAIFDVMLARNTSRMLFKQISKPGKISDEDAEKIDKEIHAIRKELFREYYES